ncbi:SpoIIE family protein phosphatase [Streptomyces virginiae]|uniref:SpoIIE family protein phosphatase n=1 Tax=Streptomyces virginiae TaxID=1961 RepID=UPI003700BC46
MPSGSPPAGTPGPGPAGRRHGRLPAHPRGLLIGVLPAARFTAATALPAPGDTLLLYTDGRTEAGTGRGRTTLYGDEARPDRPARRFRRRPRRRRRTPRIRNREEWPDQRLVVELAGWTFAIPAASPPGRGDARR